MSAPALLDTLVVIDGIKARPELNGQLGLPRSFDDEKQRYTVHLVSDLTVVALKATNLVGWADAAPGPGATTAEEIDSASPTALIRYMRDGCMLSTEGGLARACLQRSMDLPFATTGRELTAGGQIEMIVQSMDAHMHDRSEVFYLLMVISNTVVAGDQDIAGFSSIAAQMKDRAVAAGVYPRLAVALKTHTTSDIQCLALSVINAVATGGDFEATEARREAAGAMLPAVAAAMKLAPHRSNVCHFGMQAVAATLARNEGVTAPPAARADKAIELGLHSACIDAMLRHGHIAGDKGVCMHKFEVTAFGVDDNGKGNEVQLLLPGSVLLAGCQALHLMVTINGGNVGPNNEARIDALNAAGALKAIAAAVRVNPTFDSFRGHEEAGELEGMRIVQPLVVQLFGMRKMTDLVNAEDLATLMGDAAKPGLVLRAVMKFMEEEKAAGH